MNKKEVCTGLKVTKKDDGHWITFTGNGREASLHVESYLHGGVIQGAVIDWIENQFDEPEEKQPSHKNIKTLYDELLMSVESKYPEETRHETALRYIKNGV